ncbi:MAG: HD domain-containing protein [Chloroflexi bacterium]|nr:HD domain-containing protein [Chloroflexota bacterium]
MYDSYGYLLFEAGTEIPEDGPMTLAVHGVREILVEDPRTASLVVEPLIPLELVAQAAVALRQALAGGRESRETLAVLLRQVEICAEAMAAEMFPDSIGEVSMSGCTSDDEYLHVRPARVAEMSLLIGMKTGWRVEHLGSLAVAALLMDIGYMALSLDASEDSGGDEGEKDGLETIAEDPEEAQLHPAYGAALLTKIRNPASEVVEAVLQHHERWNGTGYPQGLRGEGICPAARIIALADAYYRLVSVRPHHPALMPHEAAEFVMAYGGELFDPKLVQVFSRQIPMYPTGILVKLNTGEVGIVAGSNEGHVARPVVRVIYDAAMNPLCFPYQMDLSSEEYQDRLIAQVIGY